jgi:hypothetical protein
MQAASSQKLQPHAYERQYDVQLAPMQAQKTCTAPVGRSEACTLRSAAACALGAVFATTREPSWDDAVENGMQAVELAKIPIFVPVFGPKECSWTGVACLGLQHVFFEAESAFEAPVCVEVKRTLQVHIHHSPSFPMLQLLHRVLDNKLLDGTNQTTYFWQCHKRATKTLDCRHYKSD